MVGIGGEGKGEGAHCDFCRSAGDPGLPEVPVSPGPYVFIRGGGRNPDMSFYESIEFDGTVYICDRANPETPGGNHLHGILCKAT